MEDNPTTPQPPQPESIDASNLKGQPRSEEKQPEATALKSPEERSQDRPSTWRIWWRRVKTMWLLFGEIVAFLWTLALWDSYRPKITVSPGATLNPKSPFATIFIMQNQGTLPIEDVRYLTRLAAMPLPGSSNLNLAHMQEQNVSVIPQMKYLESYGLGIHYGQVQVAVGPLPTATNHISTASMATNHVDQIGALLLTFEVSYKPKFFWGIRKDTLNFTGVPDVDGNWQWIPSAHQSIAEQRIDTNLIPAMTVQPPTNNTNGSARAHTN